MAKATKKETVKTESKVEEKKVVETAPAVKEEKPKAETKTVETKNTASKKTIEVLVKIRADYGAFDPGVYYEVDAKLADMLIKSKRAKEA